MDLVSSIALADLVSTVVFTLLGVSLMWIVWKVIDIITPFSIIQEIEQDQNIALAVLFGFLFLSIAVIIAAVIIS